MMHCCLFFQFKNKEVLKSKRLASLQRLSIVNPQLFALRLKFSQGLNEVGADMWILLPLQKAMLHYWLSPPVPRLYAMLARLVGGRLWPRLYIRIKSQTISSFVHYQ